VATAVRNGQADRGIAVCGSGAGVSAAASKFPGVRAAVCHDTYTARQAVEHDDLNVLCLGARVIGPALARALADAFLAATFANEERFLRRLEKIDAIEARFSKDR
jgi:ribose 5-phosphate isomerase B